MFRQGKAREGKGKGRQDGQDDKARQGKARQVKQRQEKAKQRQENGRQSKDMKIRGKDEENLLSAIYLSLPTSARRVHRLSKRRRSYQMCAWGLTSLFPFSRSNHAFRRKKVRLSDG
jgi:hypothetical protein